jgi:hypothetical protein
MDNVFLLLILAHLLGDFMLQPFLWIEHRRIKKWKTPSLYLHGSIHIILALLALWLCGLIEFWYLAFMIGGTHLLIDPIKALSLKKRRAFFLDQAVHFLVITISVWFLHDFNYPDISSDFISWKLVIAFLFVTKPASVLINQLLPENIGTPKPAHTVQPNAGQNGLKNAGEYIGILERLLILGFIITNNWSGIGFLLAAKSVFRFSDLQKMEQRMQTEYIMIGTLLSFSLAIAIGWWAMV